MSDPIPDSPPPRTTGGNWRWEPPSPEELEAMLPGYTVEKLLGRGGMGAVFKAVQTSLDRPVAIKILPGGIEKEDPSYSERFRNEAKVMARLLHPAMVAVFDLRKATQNRSLDRTGHEREDGVASRVKKSPCNQRLRRDHC